MADCNFALLPHVCEQLNQCSDKFVSTHKNGVGTFVEGFSPCVVSMEYLRRLSVNFVNFSSMHNQGPYGNLKDRHVNDYIGIPLTVFCNCHFTYPHPFVGNDHERLCLDSDKSCSVPHKLVGKVQNSLTFEKITPQLISDHLGCVLYLQFLKIKSLSRGICVHKSIKR